MRINTNIPAFSAFSSLNKTNRKLQKAITALSTGLRINSSSDDAAGFAVSEKMRSQITGLDTAIRNTQDAASLLQTAEGALDQTNAMLSRMRELSIQAGNDTLTSIDRQYIQLEIEELKSHIDRIADTTQFNRKRILNGSCGALWSSSDAEVKARINGGLDGIEGNYRIDIKAEPGKCQVQKSSIIKIAYSVFETQEVSGLQHNSTSEEVINIAQLSSPVSGEGWNFENNMLTITQDGSYHILGDSISTKNHITVASGVKADILLDNVNIDLANDNDPYACALDIAGAKVNLFLSGTNSLVSGGRSAGIEVPAGAEITINSNEGPASEKGTLTAKGAIYASGIGGSDSAFDRGLALEDMHKVEISRIAGKITINGGTIYAYGDNGPGIGSTSSDSDCEDMTITINGGNIYAADSRNTFINNDPGIGVSSALIVGENKPSNKAKIIIAGGTVNAQGGYNAAGIGGGKNRDSGIIKIKAGLYPGSVTANAGASSGSVVISPVNIGHGSDADDIDVDLNADISPNFSTSLVEHEVFYDVTLSEMPNFYNSSGTSLVSQPQTITITQGDGKTASITLYDTDTLQDVADKINDIIAYTFGNAQYTDNPGKFCTISDGTEGTSESIYELEDIYDNEIYKTDENGNYLLDDEDERIPLTREERIKGHNVYATMLVRSAIPGKSGELYFSGNDDLLHALGLNTIQESSESTLTASVYDSHSGKTIASGIKASGSEFKSIIPPEVDVEVSAMAGLSASWDEKMKRYVLSGTDTYSAVLHLKDNAETFQTGANMG